MKNERLLLIMELIALGVLINEETDYCIFINFSGHVDGFEIEICESKTNYFKKICATDVRTNFRKLYNEVPDNNLTTEENNLLWMKAKRDVLKQILKDQEIPLDIMETHIKTIKEYSF